MLRRIASTPRTPTQPTATESATPQLVTLGAGYNWCFVKGGDKCSSASIDTPLNKDLLRGSTRAAWKNCTDRCSCTLQGFSGNVPVAEVGCAMHPIGTEEKVEARLSTAPKDGVGSWTLVGWCYVEGGSSCEGAVPSIVYAAGAALRPCWPQAVACRCSESVWSGTQLVTELLGADQLGCDTYNECFNVGGLDCTRSVQFDGKKNDFGVSGTLRGNCQSDCDCMNENQLDIRSKLDVSLLGCSSQLSRTSVALNPAGGNDLFCFVRGGQSCDHALPVTREFGLVSVQLLRPIPIGPDDSLAIKTCTGLKAACACTTTAVSGGVKVGEKSSSAGFLPFVGCANHRSMSQPQCYTVAGAPFDTVQHASIGTLGLCECWTRMAHLVPAVLQVQTARLHTRK
jgi:hypothetical protein